MMIQEIILELLQLPHSILMYVSLIKTENVRIIGQNSR